MHQARIEMSMGGWPVSFTIEEEEITPEDIKAEIEALRAAGFEARQFGGRGGGDRAAEAWGLVTGIRAFSHEGKGVLEIEMEPEEGKFEARAAMVWEGERLLGKMPAPLAEAIRKAWATNDKRGTKFSVSSVRMECGFYNREGKLRGVDLREPGGNGVGEAKPEKVQSF